MQKMNKASDAYARGSIELPVSKLSNECPIKSEHARRAIQLFPTTEDCKHVLDSKD
jgi:hypothetical protein